MGSSKEPVLKTLLYSDIFDYPLKKSEIWRFLISGKKENKQEIYKALNAKNPFFGVKDNFYYLKGKENIVEKRKEREKISTEKIKFAQKTLEKFKFIPTVYFIGVSGSLAMKNSDKDDDIDLFVITAKNSVWVTRLIMVTILRIMGIYRKREDKNVSNKICLNMLIDETVITFPKTRQDLYTAHEIAQLLPVLNKNNFHEKFISSNFWISKFLPNAFSQKTIFIPVLNSSFPERLLKNLLSLNLVKSFARNIQFNYMKNHKTTETVRDDFLAFHPLDYKVTVLRKYKNKTVNDSYSN